MLPIVQELKDTFKPPYQIKDLFSVFISLFVMIAIPLTVIQVANQRDPRTSASIIDSSTITSDLTVKIDSPTTSQNVSGTIDVAVSASDSTVGVTSITLIGDSKVLAKINNPSSTSKFNTKFSWDTTKERSGIQNLVASATNSNNKTVRSTITRVNVTNVDTEAPGISFSNLEDGTYLSENYQIKISASDNLGIASVRLEIDSNLVKTFTKLPYIYSWDLSSVTTGIHQLKATATDFSGNSSSSQIRIYKGIKGLKG